MINRSFPGRCNELVYPLRRNHRNDIPQKANAQGTLWRPSPRSLPFILSAFNADVFGGPARWEEPTGERAAALRG